jgi:hypothetical protein
MTNSFGLHLVMRVIHHMDRKSGRNCRLGVFGCEYIILMIIYFPYVIGKVLFYSHTPELRVYQHSIRHDLSSSYVR